MHSWSRLQKVYAKPSKPPSKVYSGLIQIPCQEGISSKVWMDQWYIQFSLCQYCMIIHTWFVGSSNIPFGEHASDKNIKSNYQSPDIVVKHTFWRLTSLLVVLSHSWNWHSNLLLSHENITWPWLGICYFKSHRFSAEETYTRAIWINKTHRVVDI